tara:strand:+ start:283 stop:465 length:183 start_codon:yes stop_codon:yes gene_type:complete
MDGLTMKNGREINRRPTSELGITKMCRVMRDMKKAEKIEMIAEGNDLARSRRDIKSLFNK